MGVGVVVIGAGVAGTAHAEAFACDPRARLVGVADVMGERAAHLGKRLGVDVATPRYEDLLERSDVDLVSVCTPNASHAQVAIDSIEAGKHVLCEKPLAIPLDRARAIADAAADSPTGWVSCVYQHRADVAVRRARWLLENGFPDNVSAIHVASHSSRSADYFTGTRGTRDGDGGGSLLVQGIHMLDLLTWLLGGAVSVSASIDTRVHTVEVEDTMVGWVKMQSGAVATVECTTYAPRDEYRVEIVGDHQCLLLRYCPGGGRVWQLELCSTSRSAVRRMWRAAERAVPASAPPRALLVAGVAASKLVGRDRRARHLGHGPFIRHCLDTLDRDSGPPVPAREAMESLELALALYQSAASGTTIELPLMASEVLA